MNDDLSPYESLWRAALRVYIDDALTYARMAKAGQKITQKQQDLYEAYRDLTGCGRMLERICNYTGHDPEYLRGLFKKALKAKI